MEAVLEFPFTAELPKVAEVDESSLSRPERLNRKLAAYRALVESKGDLLPFAMVAAILKVSRQRVHELVEQGHVERIEWEGHPYIVADTVVEYVNSERKAGRPVKCIKGTREIMSAAMTAAKEV